MSIQSIQTPIGVATLIGTSPDRDRVLCMHTRVEEVDGKKRSSTYAKWWMWDGNKITDEYDKEGKL